MERVLRIIYGCIVFGKFHDGLHITSDCEKNAAVHCHARTHLHRSCGRIPTDLSGRRFTNPIRHCEADTVPRVGKHMHDSSRTKNQKHTVFCSSNHNAIHRELFARRNYGGVSSVHKGK